MYKIDRSTWAVLILMMGLGLLDSTDESRAVQPERPVVRSAINVTDPKYGAKGDGISDDTAAIQTAIDEALEQDGGEVYLPQGIYRVTDTIKLGSNLMLRGAGMGLTVIRMGNNIEPYSPTLVGLPKYGPAYQNIHLADLTLDGTREKNKENKSLHTWGHNEVQAGLQLVCTRSTTLHRVHVTGHFLIGIVVSAWTDKTIAEVSISQCTIDNNGIGGHYGGIAVAGATANDDTRVSITGCNIVDNMGMGTNVIGARGAVEIVGNHYINNGRVTEG